MRVEGKNVKEKRKGKQNQKKFKFLSYDSQAVEAMNLESTAEQTFDTASHTLHLTQDHVCDFCTMAIQKSFTKSMRFEDIIDKFAVAKCRKHPL